MRACPGYRSVFSCMNGASMLSISVRKPVGQKRLDLSHARDGQDFHFGQRGLYDDPAVFDDFGRIDVLVDDSRVVRSRLYAQTALSDSTAGRRHTRSQLARRESRRGMADHHVTEARRNPQSTIAVTPLREAKSSSVRASSGMKLIHTAWLPLSTTASSSKANRARQSADHDAGRLREVWRCCLCPRRSVVTVRTP